ncbi:MAG: TVP38/TMEM64 family protein [Alphaproteobacteria bacterium]|jgi:uncharacterized membrane protein YdjX (TVP38/TMEM64 family)
MDKSEQNSKTPWVKRMVPVVVLVALLVAFFVTDLKSYASYAWLQDNYLILMNFVDQNLVVAVLLYIAGYCLVVAASLPAATLVTLLGGFLFGWFFGTIFTVIGATIGATILFQVARTSFGEPLRKKVQPYIGKMEKGFREDEFHYLMFLRLMPAFPFFVVNLVPAFLGVSLRMFVITTFIGIIPGTSIFNFIGSGLGDILASGEAFDPAKAASPEILIGLAGLAVISLAPIVWKKIKARRSRAVAP